MTGLIVFKLKNNAIIRVSLKLNVNDRKLKPMTLIREPLYDILIKFAVPNKLVTRNKGKESENSYQKLKRSL